MLGTIKVGHADDPVALTGCTVFIPPPGTVGACDVRGGAPGTRDTELLRPTFTVRHPDAILFCGGSALGLEAAGGVARFLRERGVGFQTTAGVVPIVSAAVIFDLDLGEAVHPGEEMGYQACLEARSDDDSEGNVGAGMGASAGNFLGRAHSTRSGLGFYRAVPDYFELEVAAVANSFGEVVDGGGKVIAGARDDSGAFIEAEPTICGGLKGEPFGQNTTLVLIATNARLDKQLACRVALQGHNGIARAIRPSHTQFDGDTVFVLATGEVEAPQVALEAMAASGTSEAIRSAVLRATPAGGLPCACDILGP